MPEETTTTPEATPDVQTTSLAKKWIVKMVIFLIVLIGFGIYGLYDATIAYPKRGEASASWHLHQYLLKAEEANRLESNLNVPEGMTALEHYQDLENRRADLTQAAGGNNTRARDAAAQLARYQWLDSLKVLGKLNEERVEGDLGNNPRETLAELESVWSGAISQPKPLASYDIPVQWGFVIVGLGGGLVLLLHMMRVASRKYTWKADEMRLGLPGGATIVPADVEVFDRRKWDKFLVFLKIRPEHKELGGQEVKLDLYQYEPLETWYLEMHRSARPEDFVDEEEEAEAIVETEPASEVQPEPAAQPDVPDSQEDPKPGAGA